MWRRFEPPLDLRMSIDRDVRDPGQKLRRAVGAARYREQRWRLVDEARRAGSGLEFGMTQDVHEEREIGRDTADAVLAERSVHAQNRFFLRRGPGGHLLEHRI